MTHASTFDKTGGKPDHFRFTDALGIKFKVPVGNLEKTRKGWKIDGMSTTEVYHIRLIELVDEAGKVLLSADGGDSSVKTGEIFGLFLEEDE
jgi:hypothetical protein